MSASNWAVCPRCRKRKQAELDKRQAEVNELYGTVPFEEFDRARGEFETTDWTVPETFREDYEIHGAGDGVIHVSYGGGCSECGLSLNFEHVHPLDVDGDR